jgi:hypothetical protein
MDRKISLETIEKMKQPKSLEHKKRISSSMKSHWESVKEEKRYGFTTK